MILSIIFLAALATWWVARIPPNMTEEEYKQYFSKNIMGMK